MMALSPGAESIVRCAFGEGREVKIFPFPPGSAVQALAAAWRDDHWQAVTIGLTETGSKVSPNADVSGWGAELCVRAEGAPEMLPDWAGNLLITLASYMWQTGEPFSPWDHAPLPGFGPWGGLYAAPDAERAEVLRGANGAWMLLQVQLLTPWQYELVQRWNTEAFDRVLRRFSPLRVVSERARAQLERPEVRAELIAASQAEGQAVQVHHGAFEVKLPEDPVESPERPILGGERVERRTPGARVHLDGELMPAIRLSFELSLANGRAVYVRRSDGMHLVFTTGEVEPLRPSPALRVVLVRSEIPRLLRSLSQDSGSVRLSDTCVLSWGERSVLAP